MIYKGVDISLARRALLVRELTEGGHSAGYLKSVRAQLERLDNMRFLYTASASEKKDEDTPAPVNTGDAEWSVDEFTQLVDQLKATVGAANAASAAAEYIKTWRTIKNNAPYLQQQWKSIYGTDLDPAAFNKLNNPFALGSIPSSGANFTSMFTNLSALGTSQNLGSVVQNFNILSGTAGDWSGDLSTLNYAKLQELGKISGYQLPSQGEWAQMQTGSLQSAAGKTFQEWQDLYEDLRKKRQSMFKSEEARTAYQSTEEGFSVSGLKSKQEY